MLSQLYVTTHKKKKDNQWVDEKSKNTYVTFKKNIQQAAGISEEIIEEQDGQQGNSDAAVELENERAGEQPTQQVADDDFLQTQASLPSEEVAQAWLKAIGGTKKVVEFMD